MLVLLASRWLLLHKNCPKQSPYPHRANCPHPRNTLEGTGPPGRDVCYEKTHTHRNTVPRGPGADSNSQIESLRCDTIRKQAGGLREHSCWTTI